MKNSHPINKAKYPPSTNLTTFATKNEDSIATKIDKIATINTLLNFV